MYRTMTILSVVLAIVVAAMGLMRGRSAKASPESSRVRLSQRAVLLAMLSGMIVAAFTGMGSVIASGGPLGGWGLMLHFVGAPLFALGIAGVAILLAGRYMPDAPPVVGRGLFWLMLLAGFAVIASAFAAMTTWFGTHEQEWLLKAHGYSAMVLIVAAALYCSRQAWSR
jgi:hypothetical protein